MPLMDNGIHAYVSCILNKNKKISNMFGYILLPFFLANKEKKKKILSVLEVMDARKGHIGFIKAT